MQKPIKKYTKIVRYGKSQLHQFETDDIISITEKIDGANASFIRDENSPHGFTCYSRNQALHEGNQLRGFWQWCKDNINPDELLPHARYYGEWLCPHKIQYKEEAYQNFYLFGVYDDMIDKFLGEDVVREESNRLGLLTPELFYHGEFQSFEHLQSFIGKSKLTKEPDTGEGVVVKCMTKYDKSGNQLFLKLVSDKFREVMQQRPPREIKVIDNSAIKAVVTKARVGKLLHKLVDEGILSEDFGIEDMGIILKRINVYEDIVEEETELLDKHDTKFIKQQVGKITPLVVKEVLKEEDRI